MSKKLEQVLEFLVNGEEDKAKELLHQVFIEKARAIHEELINDDEMEEDTLEDGDFRHDVMKHDDHLEELSDEIDAEEVMGEAEDDIMDMDDAEGDLDHEMEPAADDMDDMDDMGDMDDMSDMDDMGDENGDPMSNIENTMGDLETALAALRAEFEKLEGGSEEGEEEADEEGESEEGEEEGEEEEEQEEMDEAFTEGDFDDLAEAVELEKVTAPTKGEVGSGKYSSADANAAAKSPVPSSQTSRMGAAPIKTGNGKAASDYNREAAPSSKALGNKDNRRKKSTDGMENEQTGNYGAKETASALNSTDTKFGKGNTRSPLSTAPRR